MQNSVARSSYEAELVAISDATSDAVWTGGISMSCIVSRMMSRQLFMKTIKELSAQSKEQTV